MSHHSRLVIAFFSLILAQGSLLAQSVAIGQLQLSDNSGYQSISFFNNTGPSAGCGIGGSEYLACTGIDITSWVLTVDFTNENPNDPSPSYPSNLSSPLVFSSASGETIGPFDGSNPYTGGASGTWQLPLNFDNLDEPDCGPTCDYQIAEIDFSGTLAPSDLPLRLYNGQTYDGDDPGTYTIFSADTSFTSSWIVPASDYSSLSDPAFLSDAADVLLTDDDMSSPEPSTYALIAVAMLSFFPFVRRERARLVRVRR